MNIEKIEFDFQGHPVTIHMPDNFNGKWIWKMEYQYAHQQSELDLLNEGYAKAHIGIHFPDFTPSMFASPSHLRILKNFHDFIVDKYSLSQKAILFGFSRGGLNAFNFALAYPDCVEKVYLDAPVLDLKVWPRLTQDNEIEMHNNMLKEYGLTEQEFQTKKIQPVQHFKEYFNLKIPTLLVAGDNDHIVNFKKCSALMIDYYNNHKESIQNFFFFVKVGGDHHPHSFGNNSGIDIYGQPYPQVFNIYSSIDRGSDSAHTIEYSNAKTTVIKDFVNGKQ